MEAIVERCCGLDVHQASITACLIVGGADSKPRRDVRTFRALTSDLREMAQWLREEGCTHVGMESTGVYWRPVYAILEGQFELVVGNARHIRNVPGRKTDVKDAEWIANLVRHGLIAKSFVPDAELRQLRDLIRYRKKLVQARTGEKNRLQKLLETANIKLASVLSDVFGVSGMAMLKALLEGELAYPEIADLARGSLRKKRRDIELALDGGLQEHHRFMLRMQLRRLEQLDADIEVLDARIEDRMSSYAEAREKLMTIPGVRGLASATIIAEMGTDMSVFHSPAHLASWAGICPGNNESAGKRKRGKTTRGNVYLKTALVEAAQAAVKVNGCYLKDKFHRLKARRGGKRALIAIAHKILIAAYHLLRDGEAYRDLGEAYLDQLREKTTARVLKRRLERLGFEVTLAPAALPST